MGDLEVGNLLVASHLLTLQQADVGQRARLN